MDTAVTRIVPAVLCCTLALHGSSSSSAQHLQSNAIPVSRELVGAIVEHLASSVHALSRPVYTYHYAMRTRMGLGAAGYVPPDTDRAWQYVTMKIGRYWDLSLPTHPNATVSGLYVGTDPVISRAFGGVADVWGMVQLVLDSGFRFIDVRRGLDAGQRGDKLPQAIRDALTATGCNAPYADVLLTFLESDACRAVAVEVMKHLRVDGILYSFQRYAFPECPDRADGGFIVVNAAAARPELARIFVTDTADDAATIDRLRVRELFVRARRAGSRRLPPWPNLANDAPPPDVDRWMREHLFGCGAHVEDWPVSVTSDRRR